jgi:hypothetical protein
MIGRGHQLDFYPVGIFKIDGVIAFPSGIRVSVKVEDVYPFFQEFFR